MMLFNISVSFIAQEIATVTYEQFNVKCENPVATKIFIRSSKLRYISRLS